MHSNKPEQLAAHSALTVSTFDSLSKWQSHTAMSGVVIFHHTDTSVVTSNDVPITLVLLAQCLVE